ncbi:SMP-30/gluconolactonase/LRE family protein [Microbacterium marmarense]|uniref:SMP-30/gluconolactonase/LRE family protein n=1 Tax=Microbacterium marmarense TaxID=3122051 RepID=A0ABU8LQX8_9MICO
MPDFGGVAPLITELAAMRAEFGEGPAYIPESDEVVWVDIPAGAIHRTHAATGATRSVTLKPPVSGAWPASGGELVVAAGSEILRIGVTGRTTRVLQLTQSSARANDGAVDRDGRLWVGTMPLPADGSRTGELWRISLAGIAERMDDDLALPNGMGWSPDGKRFYLVDSLARRIYVYSIIDDVLGTRETFVNFDDVGGIPDGMAVDEEGCLWVVVAETASMCRYDPDAVLLAEMRLPVARPTSCAFGGLALDELYVTTATENSAAESCETLGGKLLRTQPGVRGLPVTAVNTSKWK